MEHKKAAQRWAENLQKKTNKKCLDFIGKQTEEIHNSSANDVKKYGFTIALLFGFYLLGRLTRLLI